jgi:hypothetical protein
VASTIIYVISTIVGYVLISQGLKCESWKDDPPQEVIDEFNKRDDKDQDWDDWSDEAYRWCKSVRTILYTVNSVGLLFTGLIATTAIMTRQQINRWDVMGTGMPA